MDIGTQALNYEDSNEFTNLRYAILSYEEQVGGIVTISCHFGNPWWFVEKGKGDPYRYRSIKHKNPVADILDGKTLLFNKQTVKEWYDVKLNTIINFISSLKDNEL